MRIFQERPRDRAGVRAVEAAAFETGAEADLVDALRESAASILSLVAERDGAIVGHVLFSPVTLVGAAAPEPALLGLAPLAVAPGHQRAGVGSALVRAGLDWCRALDVEGVVVLGDPAYYSRFGFTPASDRGLRCEYDVPDGAFQCVELVAGALAGRGGLVRYHAAFAAT